MEIIIAVITTLALLGLGFWTIRRSGQTKQIPAPVSIETKSEIATEIEITIDKTALAPAQIPAPATLAKQSSPIVDVIQKSFAQRLKDGLAKSRKDVWGKVESLFVGKKLDDQILEEVEELLFTADLGPEMVQSLIGHLNQHLKGQEIDLPTIKKSLYEFLSSQMQPIQEKRPLSLFNFQGEPQKSPEVIMIVGVNGAGKTTTIGKLATKLTRQGAKVVVGACDTFRAAAVDQLQVWCDRSGATMVRAKEGADPSGVGYEALQRAIQLQADYCILDTAGRLHTKENLMEELKKSKRVLTKLRESAPDHILLVIDAITGQNALKQAEEFNKTLGLTGLIFTKCDGSSRAGNAVSIVKKLQVPLTYIGVGETVDDLDIFDLSQYLHALLDMEDSLTEGQV